jgi:hypothetical protein
VVATGNFLCDLDDLGGSTPGEAVRSAPPRGKQQRTSPTWLASTAWREILNQKAHKERAIEDSWYDRESSLCFFVTLVVQSPMNHA